MTEPAPREMTVKAVALGLGLALVFGAANAYLGMRAGQTVAATLPAAIIAMALFYPITFYLGRATENFFTGINIYNYYVVNFGQIFLTLVGSGIVIGIISSYLAVRRYLRR